MARRDNVRLNIQLNSSAGFKQATGSNSTVFYYKYTGGNSGAGAGNGNNDFRVGPKQTFDVTFQGNDDQTYRFQTDAFMNKDGAADLSGSNSDTTVIVTDQCSTVGSWNYGVKVEVIIGVEAFECDPVIVNR